ncbi:hypothetical protein FHW88_004930 [Mucilaginibacter sp. SG538B]|nr:hypothetical protein [Mucilaginibacter sp. SG538B]
MHNSDYTSADEWQATEDLHFSTLMNIAKPTQNL